MSIKRMFSKTIVDSDAFMDMPASSQLLYFHLCMRADDEGFVGNPKRIMRMVGSGDDDFKVLLSKRFVIPFESGVCVIKHWLIHNTIRMDRFNPTNYQEEKKLLEIKDNRSYSVGLPNGNQMVTQVKLSKVKLIKNKKGSPVAISDVDNKSISELIKEFETVDLKNKNYYGNKTQRKACKFLIDEYGFDKSVAVIKLLPKLNQQKLYIGQITSPFELQEKWQKVVNVLTQKKQDKLSKDNIAF